MITIDFETRSYADLKKSGTWAYSEHETTDVICFCYAIGDNAVQEWWPGKNKTDNIPDDLWEALEAGDTIEAHHAAFEIAIWINIMSKKYDWPKLLY